MLFKMVSVNVYGFSYKNEERKKRMTRRFEVVGFPITWVEPVLSTDTRITAQDSGVRRNHSIMFNHLDMIAEFLKSDADYGVFCEDDIYISKSFHKDIYRAIEMYERNHLDVLLLGYLVTYKPITYNVHNEHTLIETPFTLHKVPKQMWGSQMYLMNRKTAEKMISELSNPETIWTEFSPDWAITKFGNAGAIYPMLAVEEGNVVTNDWGQINFHKECLKAHYVPENYF